MTPARFGRAATGALALAGAATLAAGCTAAVPPAAHSPAASATRASVAPPASTPVTTATHTRPSRPTSTAPTVPSRTRTRVVPPPVPSTTVAPPPVTTSAAPPPPPAPSSTHAPPPAPKSSCHAVSIRLIRGGAAQGTEIAALQFTNDGHQSCVLVGYANVVLSRGGNTIGSPSQPGGPYPGRAVRLNPGQTTQSLLRDYSSCQAPLSDSATVTVPGSTISGARPAELRACTLRVGQLGKPS